MSAGYSLQQKYIGYLRKDDIVEYPEGGATHIGMIVSKTPSHAIIKTLRESREVKVDWEDLVECRMKRFTHPKRDLGSGFKRPSLRSSGGSPSRSYFPSTPHPPHIQEPQLVMYGSRYYIIPSRSNVTYDEEGSKWVGVIVSRDSTVKVNVSDLVLLDMSEVKYDLEKVFCYPTISKGYVVTFERDDKQYKGAFVTDTPIGVLIESFVSGWFVIDYSDIISYLPVIFPRMVV